jgi:hypothetical protein
MESRTERGTENSQNINKPETESVYVIGVSKRVLQL